MKVVTFYSYKGGVGRTMALVNTAHVFARKGWRVLMADFDLEAPGMTHFFAEAVRSSGSRYDALDFLLRAKSSMDADEDELVSLKDYVTTIPLPADWVAEPRCGIPYLSGRLDLLPATLNPVVFEEQEGRDRRDYLRRMDRLNLARIFSSWERGQNFGRHVRSLLARVRFPAAGDLVFTLREEVMAAYDIVLIDSRTGLNEVSGLSIGPISNALVICCGLNQQNVYGTQFLMERAAIRKPCAITAGPVPPWREEEVEQRIAALKAALRTDEVIPVPYHPSAALTEMVFVAEGSKGPMSRAFERLAARIVDMIRDDMPERAFYKNFLGADRRRPANESEGGARIVAERLARKRLTELRQLKDLRGVLALFPTALTVSCLPPHGGRTLLEEDVGPVSLAAALATYRNRNGQAILHAEELPVDGAVREKLAVRLSFFRWRLLGEPPSADLAEAFVRRAFSAMKERPEYWWNCSWPELCHAIDVVVVAIHLAKAGPHPSVEVAEELRASLRSRFSQRSLARRIFPFRVQSGEAWLKLFTLMAGIRDPGELSPAERDSIKEVLKEVPPIAPINGLMGEPSALWPSLLDPVLLDNTHFDLEQHGYMALGSWAEPLAAAATHCVWGKDRMTETVSWIALARWNYGYAWRALIDWNLLAGLKDDEQFSQLMNRDDAEIEQVERDIDAGIYPL